MTSALLVLLCAALLLGALALPAGASARDRCRPRAHERVLQRSDRAVLLGRGSHVLGCSRATGKRRFLYKPYEHEEFSGLRALRLVGTVVVLVDSSGDHYGQGIEQLIVDDAVHRGRQELLEGVYWPASIEVMAARENGDVAWIVRDQDESRLGVHRATGGAHTLDTGFELSDVQMTATSLSWRHGSEQRSWSLESPSACMLPRPKGTPDLDLVGVGDMTRVCLRSTGRTLEVPMRLWNVLVAGTWVAWEHDDVITVRDVETDRSVDVAAPDAWRVVVDEHGSLAWLAEEHAPDGLRMAVWVHDAQGKRIVGHAEGDYRLARDGSTVKWRAADGDATVTLAAP